MAAIMILEDLGHSLAAPLVKGYEGMKTRVPIGKTEMTGFKFFDVLQIWSLLFDAGKKLVELFEIFVHTSEQADVARGFDFCIQ